MLNFKWLMAIAILALLAQVSNAALLDDLTLGVVNKLEDNDLDKFIDANGNGDVDVGETFEVKGWIQAKTPPANEIEYDETVDAFTFAGTGSVLSITPLGGGFSLLNLSDLVVDVYDDPPVGTAAGDFVGGVHADINVATTVDATNGTLLGSFSAAASPTTFFSVVTDSLTIASIGLLTFGGDLDEVGNTTPSLDDGTTKIPLRQHDFLGLTNPFGPSGLSHLEVSGGLDEPGNADWQFRTDANFYILPVPEASSVVIWALSIGGLGAVVGRRRRRR